jgi:C4-dicarboxylate-specific signal transduction histidine kinase
VIDTAGGIPERRTSDGYSEAGTAREATPLETATTRSSGAGLGLAIVQGIVQAHRGRVVVQNVPGGCRFDVFLP